MRPAEHGVTHEFSVGGGGVDAANPVSVTHMPLSHLSVSLQPLVLHVQPSVPAVQVGPLLPPSVGLALGFPPSQAPSKEMTKINPTARLSMAAPQILTVAPDSLLLFHRLAQRIDAESTLRPLRAKVTSRA